MGKPKIRFKGFDDDWEQRKFGELAEYKKGPFGSAITKSMFVPKSADSVKVYEQQNAINKDWSLERYFLPKEYAYTKLKAFEVHGGDIIVSCAGTIGEIYEIPDNAEYGVINQALMRVRVDEKIVDKRMFIIAFSNMINEFTRTHSNGSAIKNIPPFADLKPMKVLMPSMEEQRVISEYFEKMDHLITLHQRKCDETKKLKKYMLQKMFPQNGQTVPEIRFSGFTDVWEQRKLIEVCDYVDYRGKTPTKTEDGIFLVTAKNVKDGFIDYETSKEYISENTYEEVMRRGKPEIGDVLITTEAPCGNVAQVNKADIALAQRIIKYRGHIGVVDNTYLKHYLLSPEFQKILNAKSSGGTVQGIKGSILHQQKIIYPSYEEQKKIGQHMDSLDNLITLHQQKCDELRNIKKFMLQNMFA